MLRLAPAAHRYDFPIWIDCDGVLFPSATMSTQPYVQPGEPLSEFLRSFWQRQVDTAEQETPDYRHPPLPLARIKKVMKSDPDVKVSPDPFCFSLAK